MNPAQATALLALSLCAASAQAADLDRPQFAFSAFGTLGVVHSGEKLADFTAAPSKPRGAGFSRSPSAEVDSLVAVQLDVRPHQRLSAVVQVISEQNYDHTFRPHVEWANVTFRVTPEFDIRVGRTVLPILMVTESRKVGYANPWVRPPVEVYNLVPFTNNDGIDASYRVPVGAASNTLRVAAGRSNPRFPVASGTTTARVRESASVSDTVEHGFAALRVSYGRARVTIPAANTLFDAFRQLGPAGVAIAERYDVKDTLVTFAGAGASFDPGPWFAMGEWTRTRSDSVRGRKTAWYAGGGARFGKLTPYALYARAKADNLSDPGLATTDFPPALAQAGAGLNAALSAALSAKPVQRTVSVGGRWDMSKNTAFKLQFDRTRIGAGSTGTLGNIQPGFQPGGRLQVWSATIDFVFR